MIGAGQRGNAYSVHASLCPEELRIVGVAEPDITRRREYQKLYDLPDDKCFETWQDVFTEGKWADVVMICTQDSMHYEPAMAAIGKGYDILLEKPIAPTAAQCREVAAAAKAKGVKVLVCHVMRYTPFFRAIKEVIESGDIGKVVTVVHNENVGDFHQAHSFVRGNWGNCERSSPMILAKSCHDMDFLQWLVDKKCLRLSSFGSLSYFNRENKPQDTPSRCTDGCKADCLYDARRAYTDSDNEWFRSVAAGHASPTDEEVESALKNGPYGRCVFLCDNDVVDHQVVSMEFEDGVTVIFSMSAFTPDCSRSIKIMGTKGQIKAHTVPHSIEVSRFAPYPHLESRTVKMQEGSGHGGGDAGIMRSFCSYIRGGGDARGMTDIGISAENHLLCFAAEQSRLNNGTVVEMKDFMR
jgi:predicted dehydrogenase